MSSKSYIFQPDGNAPMLIDTTKPVRALDPPLHTFPNSAYLPKEINKKDMEKWDNELQRMEEYFTNLSKDNNI